MLCADNPWIVPTGNIARAPTELHNPWIAQMLVAWYWSNVGSRGKGSPRHSKPGMRALSAMVDRDAFEDHVKRTFVDQKKNVSKVMTRSRGAEITAYLLGSKEADDVHFKFWIKSRGFCLMDYPVLGLKKVLCLPAKKKVCLCKSRFTIIMTLDSTWRGVS